ncbi:hypothetical protein MMC06_000723 [Schaereria dolodes]|nr:hypothetical protein [Schaereria dolodes]
MLGSAILVSSAVVHVRRKAFERKFTAVIEEERQRRKAQKASTQERGFPFALSRRRSVANSESEVDKAIHRGMVAHARKLSLDLENGGTIKSQDRPSLDEQDNLPSNLRKHDVHHIQASNDSSGLTSNGHSDFPGGRQVNSRISFSSPLSPLRTRHHTQVFSRHGGEIRREIFNPPQESMARMRLNTMKEKGKVGQDATSNFESGGLIGRNSQFHNLTLNERERLGGVEYRAIKLLERIVPLYFLLWQLLGSLGLGAYVAKNRPDTALENGLNPWWVGAFNAVSAFNNSGMSLLDANMVAFQTADYMLISVGLLILAGNTCYPIFLRLIIWTLLKLLPNKPAYEEYKVTLRFLLDHPRRCYTTLFPSNHTWWLLTITVLLNGIDWAAFEILNIGNNLIETLPSGTRVLAGLFQAIAVRSGGFYIVSIAQLRIALLNLYVIMMYISVYPVVITMRNSNVYEERSLGIYADDSIESSQPAEGTFLAGLKYRLTNRGNKESRGYFIRQQLRGQLAHDLWWIVLAVLLIMITETGHFERDPVNYSVFNVIFEVISAYGCVGISVGLPDVAYSFCGGWHVLSKLILCAVMIRGRHRGLPVAIDRAVLLPGEHLGAAEEEDAQIKLERSLSRHAT